MADLSLVVPAPCMFRAEEAARYLGVSRSTVYRELAAGRLPSVRIRNTTRIPQFALDRWIEAQIAGSGPGDAAVGCPLPPGPTASDGRFSGAGAPSPRAPEDRPEPRSQTKEHQ